MSQDNPPTNIKDRAEWDKREIERGKSWDKSEAERLKKQGIKEEFSGDDLVHGQWYDIKKAGQIIGDEDLKGEDFEYVGFDRGALEHIFVSHDAGGDTFIKVSDEEVEDLVVFPIEPDRDLSSAKTPFIYTSILELSVTIATT